jgi:LPXTG-motif cell wall-anchored protein
MRRFAALGIAYAVTAALVLPASPLAADGTATAPATAPTSTTPAPTATAPASTTTTPAPAPQPTPAPPQAPTTRSAKPAKPPKAAEPPKAHAAAPGSVTIRDFSYGPATVTVNAGDSVTWVNNGPTKHSATAQDGSFDTGLLAKGASASHTFTKAGTFAYVCSIHPFMHGTVKVVAAAAKQQSSGGGSTSSSSAPSGGATSPATAAPSSKPTLPRTGQDAAILALLGVLFVGLGFVVRPRSPAA